MPGVRHLSYGKADLFMRGIYLVVFVGLFSSSLNSINDAGNTVAAEQRAAEAKVLWEQALAAKGGRKRLYSVKNMVISSSSEYRTHRGRRNNMRREELLVFPDRVWKWEDYRPDVFGLRIDMINYETLIRYVVTPDSKKEDEIRRISGQPRWEDSGLINSQVVYFMETRWIKPTPTAVRRGEVKKQQVSIVQTQVEGKRVDFALDPKTHLPIKVTFFYEPSGGLEGGSFSVYLSDYIEVAGVKVPQSLIAEDNSVFNSKIQINVEYDERIFVTPTTVEAGPGAWRVK